MLAQGEKDGSKIKESKKFEKIAIDIPDIHFLSISAYNNGAIAIDHRGKLWGWGVNEDQFQGFLDQNSEGLFKPTEIQPLNALNMKAKKAEICYHHSLVLFEDESGKETLYSVGINNAKYLGVNDDQLGDLDSQKKKPFREIPSFGDITIADFNCTERGSLVIIEADGGKPAEQLYIHTMADGSKV